MAKKSAKKAEGGRSARRIGPCLPLIFGLAACSEQAQTVHVAPPQQTGLAFLLELDSRESVVRSEGPLRLEDGVISPEPTTFVPSGNGSIAYLLVIDEDSIRESTPNYVPERWKELKLRPSTDEPVLDPLQDPNKVPLPEFELFELPTRPGVGIAPAGTSALTAVADLILSVPVNPDYCRNQFGAFQPYGAAPMLLTGDVVGFTDTDEFVRALNRVVEMGPEQIVASSPRLLTVLSRGGEIAMPDPTATAPYRTIDPRYQLPGRPGANDPMPGFVRILALAADKSSGSIWIGGDISNTPYTLTGFIYELRFAGGGLTPVGTATVATDPNWFPGVSDIAVGPGGEIIAVGDGGLLLYRSEDSDVFRLVDVPELDGQDLTSIVFTGDPTRPHLIGARDESVLLGDVSTGSLQLTQLRDPAERPFAAVVRTHAVSAYSAERELWAGGAGGLLYRRQQDEPWRPFVLPLPPSADPCSDGLGWKELHPTTASVIAHAQGVFLEIGDCVGVLASHRADGCVATLPLPDRPIGRKAIGIDRLRLDGDRLFAVGGMGAVYFLDLDTP